jgi:MtfA peptidase
LDFSNKAKFHDRIEKFIDRKSITGRQSFIVTQEVRVTLAAAAVQVTFGLDTWDLDYFSQILIYPSEYRNPQTKLLHKGETNLGGFMCFSWADFLKGNQTPDDKINLGLHEFAHALRFNGIKGNETDYFFDNYFKRWLACAYIEFSRMKKGHESVLRKYGSVNINEFFSVVVETFFETPLEFKSKLPSLYLYTSILLNQTFTDDDRLLVNCREYLLQESDIRLEKDYDNAIIFNLRYNGLFFIAVAFFIVGLFSMQGGGYLYPPPYIMFAFAILSWLYLEFHYCRLYFHRDKFTLVKGYLIIQRLREIYLPYSNIISFEVRYEYVENKQGETIKQISEANLTYYKDGDFYTEDLSIDIKQPQFDELCSDLRRNFVHVFIRD